MTATAKENQRRFPSGRLLRWAAIIMFAVVLAWLAAWLAQRSLRSQARKRAAQSWLDEKLNADVSFIGDMSVRVNLLRPSRLSFSNIEIEHPSAAFPGKFLVAGRIEAKAQPWALAGLWPDRLDLVVDDFRLVAEEDEAGEWSLDGLARPINADSGATVFPFPIPEISAWRAEFLQGLLVLRRHGHELGIELAGEASSGGDGDKIVLALGKTGFTFGKTDGTGGAWTGGAGPISAILSPARSASGQTMLFPERCAIAVENLPTSILRFLIAGLPMEETPGQFTGTIKLHPLPEALAVLTVEGELGDAPLTSLGLPHRIPIRVSWPIGPKNPNLRADIRLGPPGFGSFEISMPLDETGKPRLLSLKGDVAVLDHLLSLFASRNDWIEWLTLTFPAVEWRSASWLGFGWSGNNMSLSLTRTASGLRLSGEADFAGGRVRIDMTPKREDIPASVTVEGGDARIFADAFASSLPEAFRAKLSGGDVALTWRGMPDDEGSFNSWGAGFVFSDPEIRMTESGSWWGGLTGVAKAVSEDLPYWGGGDANAILRLTTLTELRPSQISIVVNRNEFGQFGLEFRSYGQNFGQMAGYLEKNDDGDWQGETILFGPSRLIEETTKANSDFGRALAELAHGTGLGMTFRINAGGDPVFAFPFLEEAKYRRDIPDGSEVGE